MIRELSHTVFFGKKGTGVTDPAPSSRGTNPGRGVSLLEGRRRARRWAGSGRAWCGWWALGRGRVVGGRGRVEFRLARLFLPGTVRSMIQYRAVVRVLGEVRDEVLGRFSELGGNRDRWVRVDWGAMAHALTAAEDRLELGRGREALRLALRGARRELEAHLA